MASLQSRSKVGCFYSTPFEWEHSNTHALTHAHALAYTHTHTHKHKRISKTTTRFSFFFFTHSSITFYEVDHSTAFEIATSTLPSSNLTVDTEKM